MKTERVILPGILCKCVADKNGITFSPEFGKTAVFSYKDIIAIKSREGELLKQGRFVVVAKDGRSMSMKVFYRENRRMKRMLMFLMEQVPGDVTFRKLSGEDEKKAGYHPRKETVTAVCPKCHSTQLQKIEDGRLTGRFLTKGKLVCLRCEHQFVE